MEIKSRVVEYIIAVLPQDKYCDYKKGGVLVYCKKKAYTERTEEDMLDYLDENEDDFTRGVVKRDDKIVFVGCEDVFKDCKK